MQSCVLRWQAWHLVLFAAVLPAGCSKSIGEGERQGSLNVSPTSAPTVAAKPNILVYMIDTLRADELGCYGAQVTKTPNIDRFATEATLFENAISVAPSTRPAVASLLTGVHPQVHGALNTRAPLDQAIRALRRVPELLAQQGYHTAAIIANPNAAGVFGFASGFDSFKELYATRSADQKLDTAEMIADAPKVVEEVQRAVEAMPADRPWFLFVLSIDPHDPYTPPPPYDKTYDPEADPQRDGAKEALKRFDREKHGKPRSFADRIRALYRGEISYADEHFGRLREWLRARGALDRMALILTADHGEEFLEHGERSHGRALYEESVHVPLIIRYPAAFKAELRRGEPVDTLDLSTTLVKLGGAELPPYWLGRDLRGSLVPRPIFSAHHNLAGTFKIAVRWQDYKCIDKGMGQRDHFHLPDDPIEKRPLTGAALQRAEQALAGLIENYTTSTAALREQMVKGQIELTPEQLPEDVLKSLKALGYVE